MGILEDRLTKGILERCNKTGEMLGKQISLPYPQKLTRSDIEKRVKRIIWENIGVNKWTGYFSDSDYYTFEIFKTYDDCFEVYFRDLYIDEMDTIDSAKQRSQEWLTNLICSAMGVEE